MEKITKKIIAIGGGGFTHESDDTLDQFFLDQCSKKKIKLGFLATASKDDVKKISIFYKKFKNKNLEISHFNLTQKIDGFSSWILNKDIIYVGGGNTSFMLAIWRINSLDKIFKKASGTIAGKNADIEAQVKSAKKGEVILETILRAKRKGGSI